MTRRSTATRPQRRGSRTWSGRFSPAHVLAVTLAVLLAPLVGPVTAAPAATITPRAGRTAPQTTAAAASSDRAAAAGSAARAAKKFEKAATLVLLQASPGAGAVLSTAPRQVQLTFSVEPTSGSTLAVTGPDGAAVTGTVVLSGFTMSKPLRSDLPAGSYSVKWRAKHTEAQVSAGSYVFMLAGGPTPSPSSPPRPTTTPVWSPPPTAAGSVPIPVPAPSPATGPAGAPAAGTTSTIRSDATAPAMASGSTPGMTPGSPGTSSSGSALGTEVDLFGVSGEGGTLTGDGPAQSRPGSAWRWPVTIMLLALMATAFWGLLRRRRARRTATAPDAGQAPGEPAPGEPAQGATTSGSAAARQDVVIDLFTPVTRPPDPPLR